MIVKLDERKVKMCVTDLNKVLDEHKIFGKTFNKQVIKQLILENLSKKATIELIKELEETPISDWND